MRPRPKDRRTRSCRSWRSSAASSSRPPPRVGVACLRSEAKRAQSPLSGSPKPGGSATRPLPGTRIGADLSQSLPLVARAENVEACNRKPGSADCEVPAQRPVAGQCDLVTAGAITGRDALDPELSLSDAQDVAYAALSPEVHRILTVERGWTADRYERWLTRVLSSLLRPQPARRPKSPPHSADQ
jgi:hypothetical protein